ncbi:MAG: 50S ribosomal protein L32 [Patescibacteria group bacterium]
MTPLPKKRHAKSRTRTRKATIKLTLPTLIKCINCGKPRLPHRVCAACGAYGKGPKELVKKDEKKG